MPGLPSSIARPTGNSLGRRLPPSAPPAPTRVIQMMHPRWRRSTSRCGTAGRSRRISFGRRPARRSRMPATAGVALRHGEGLGRALLRAAPGQRLPGGAPEGMRRALDRIASTASTATSLVGAYSQRGYSRYDYSRWDGFSADLDADGSVLRLKCDNAFVTESAQLRMLHEVLSRGSSSRERCVGPPERQLAADPALHRGEGTVPATWVSGT